MDTNLIKDIPHFSRAELPLVLKRIQVRLGEWLKELPGPVARRLKARLPKLDARKLPVELLGALDEGLCLYKDARDNLIKLQAYLDHRELPEDPAGQNLSLDLGMLMLIHVLQDLCWVLQAHQEALQRQLSPQGTQEYVQAQFSLYVRKQEWLL